MAERGSGRYELSDWDAGGDATLTASGTNAEETLIAGLSGVVAAAGGTRPKPGTENDASAAAAIRGQGADLAAVFAELTADLLAQLDANGAGLSAIRLDGVLETDDGFTAWGYAMGASATNPPPIGVTLVGDPTLENNDRRVILRCRLRRAA